MTGVDFRLISPRCQNMDRRWLGKQTPCSADGPAEREGVEGAAWWRQQGGAMAGPGCRPVCSHGGVHATCWYAESRGSLLTNGKWSPYLTVSLLWNWPTSFHKGEARVYSAAFASLYTPLKNNQMVPLASSCQTQVAHLRKCCRIPRHAMVPCHLAKLPLTHTPHEQSWYLIIAFSRKCPRRSHLSG